jgi:predicted dinucleotide-binding enzyme
MTTSAHAPEKAPESNKDSSRADAKKTVSDLIDRLGFAPVDLGDVNQGRLVQFPGGPLAIVNLVKFD